MKPIVVYQIKNKINNKRYIGSSINGKERIKHHFYLLKKNEHGNPLLQDDFNKYGEKSFEVKVIYQVYDEKIARQLERDFIIQNNTLNEYNQGKF